MTTVKLSFSILDAWAKGNWEQAVSYYLGKPFPPTPAMELGRLKHQIWERQIKQSQCLPQELGGELLESPVLEQKYEKLIPFSDDIVILLRGVPDCSDDYSDGVAIHEFKCGMTTAKTYIDSLQLDYYKLLLPQANIGYYHCYNPYFDRMTRGIKYLSDKNGRAALEHIISNAGEMIDYLQSQKLLINFDRSKR